MSAGDASGSEQCKSWWAACGWVPASASPARPASPSWPPPACPSQRTVVVAAMSPVVVAAGMAAGMAAVMAAVMAGVVVVACEGGAGRWAGGGSLCQPSSVQDAGGSGRAAGRKQGGRRGRHERRCSGASVAGGLQFFVFGGGRACRWEQAAGRVSCKPSGSHNPAMRDAKNTPGVHTIAVVAVVAMVDVVVGPASWACRREAGGEEHRSNEEEAEAHGDGGGRSDGRRWMGGLQVGRQQEAMTRCLRQAASTGTAAEVGRERSKRKARAHFCFLGPASWQPLRRAAAAAGLPVGQVQAAAAAPMAGPNQTTPQPGHLGSGCCGCGCVSGHSARTSGKTRRSAA